MHHRFRLQSSLSLALVATLALVSLPAQAADTEPDKNGPTKIAVMNFKAPGFEAGVVDNLYGLFVSEIDSVPGYQVVSNDEIQAMLGFEAQKNMLGCDDTSCLAEIAGALGVDKLVAGKVGKVGETFVINITLINQKTARVEKRVVRTVTGKDDVLIQAIIDAAHTLIGDTSSAAQAQTNTAATTSTQLAQTAKANKADKDEAKAEAEAEAKDKSASTKDDSVLPLILTAAGGLSVLAGAGLGAFSALRYGDYKNATTHEEAHALGEELPLLWIGSGAVGGLGLLAAGAGAVLMMSEGGDE